MRLSEYELKTITQTFLQYFGKQDELWLFGSRADDQKKGGDIDLFIHTHEHDLKKIFDAKISFLLEIKSKIGEQKIDVIVQTPSDEAPIYQQAKTTGVRLL